MTAWRAGPPGPFPCPDPQDSTAGELKVLENLAEQASLDSQNLHERVRGARSPRGLSKIKTGGFRRLAGAATPALASSHPG